MVYIPDARALAFDQYQRNLGIGGQDIIVVAIKNFLKIHVKLSKKTKVKR
jgi:hypothetical protein